MKKFTLSILAVVITAFAMTSCIDNAVSPEVKALRAAQVNLLNAQTALKTADVAYRNAETAYKAAETAWKTEDARHRAAEAEGVEIANDSLLIALEIQAATAEVSLKAQELALEKAINALAEYIAQYDVKLAAKYLLKYSNATDSVKIWAAKVAQQIELITRLELYNTVDAPTGNGGVGTVSGPGNAYYSTVEEWYERDLADAELTLTNAENLLTVLLAIQVDPATSEAEKAALKATIQDLNNKILKQDVVIAPLQNTLNDANGALYGYSAATPPVAYTTKAAATVGSASGKLQKEDNALAAIALIEKAKTDNEAAVVKAETDAAKAVTDANAKFAMQISQLKPYVDALESTYAAQGAFGDSIINIVQATRIGINALRVTAKQEETSTGSATAAFAKAKTSVNNVIARIRTITGRSTTLMPWDANDETKYPGYQAQTTGEYALALSVAATAAQATAANTTFTQGGVTYTVKTAVAAGDLFINVTGNGTPTAGAMVKAPAAPTADVTITGTTYGTVNAGAFNAAAGPAGFITAAHTLNDQDGKILSDEIDAMIAQLIGTTLNTGTGSAAAGDITGAADLNPSNAVAATSTLAANYKSATALYSAIGAFFSGGQANTLVVAIGKYDITPATDFTDNFKDNGKGVVANMTINGPGADWTGVSGVTVKQALVTTTKAYFTAGIDKGDATADGLNGTAATLDDALRPGTAPTTDKDKLATAYAQVKKYTGLADGGYTKAVAAKAGVTTAQTAAAAVVAPLATAITAAQKAVDDATKVNTAYNKTKSDTQAILDKVNLLFDNATTTTAIEGLNAEVIGAKNAVESAQKGVDDAEKALNTLDSSLEHLDAKIAYEEERLEGYEANYEAALEVASEWLALLNDALGN